MMENFVGIPFLNVIVYFKNEQTALSTMHFRSNRIKIVSKYSNTLSYELSIQVQLSRWQQSATSRKLKSKLFLFLFIFWVCKSQQMCMKLNLKKLTTELSKWLAVECRPDILMWKLILGLFSSYKPSEKLPLTMNLISFLWFLIRELFCFGKFLDVRLNAWLINFHPVKFMLLKHSK